MVDFWEVTQEGGTLKEKVRHTSYTQQFNSLNNDTFNQFINTFNVVLNLQSFLFTYAIALNIFLKVSNGK